MLPSGSIKPWFAVDSPAVGSPNERVLGRPRNEIVTASPGSQFRPSSPPPFGSPVFISALQRVRNFSDTRTPEQLDILNFWNDPGAVGAHAGHWNQIAVGLIVRDNLNERKAVHVLESLNLAISDASIACLDAKYTFWYVRAVSGRRADHHTARQTAASIVSVAARVCRRRRGRCPGA